MPTIMVGQTAVFVCQVQGYMTVGEMRATALTPHVRWGAISTPGRSGMEPEIYRRRFLVASVGLKGLKTLLHNRSAQLALRFAFSC